MKKETEYQYSKRMCKIFIELARDYVKRAKYMRTRMNFYNK